MYILTPENKSLETSLIPDSSDTLHYCIFDHTDNDDVDFRFPPMVFLEEYSKPAIELRIGDLTVLVPLSWAILLGDENCPDLEILALSEFHGRDFKAFVFNPVSGYMAHYFPIEVINIYQDIKWNVPSVQPTHMLAVPLIHGENPPCAFFSESKNKLPEVVDLGKIL